MTNEEMKKMRAELGDQIIAKMEQIRKIAKKYAKAIGYKGEFLITTTMGSHDSYAVADAFPKRKEEDPLIYLYKEERSHDGVRWTPKYKYIGEEKTNE